MNTRIIGSEGEERALQYLLKKGYTLITRNWGIAKGEIDLIMLSFGGELVFVEVKYVSQKGYGEAGWRVNNQKLATIYRVAQSYMKRQELTVPASIDVVAITGDEVEHYCNCFSL